MLLVQLPTPSLYDNKGHSQELHTYKNYKYLTSAAWLSFKILGHINTFVVTEKYTIAISHHTTDHAYLI